MHHVLFGSGTPHLMQFRLHVFLSRDNEIIYYSQAPRNGGKSRFGKLRSPILSPWACYPVMYGPLITVPGIHRLLKTKGVSFSCALCTSEHKAAMFLKRATFHVKEQSLFTVCISTVCA